MSRTTILLRLALGAALIVIGCALGHGAVDLRWVLTR